MAQDYGQAQMFQSREQFRMCRLQVYNWGTFDKLHSIPVAEKGFLFVGRSGSGKTTLLDAFSALLTPPKWVNFNAAAQETEGRGRDRTLATYVRGAWAEQKDGGSGEVATQYLRTGATWSALALSFRNTDTRVLTLVQLFWMRGTASGAGDVHRHFMIFERAFDITELDDFDLDIRRLKRSLPGAFHANAFSPYCERFRRLLKIDSDMALRLLHKTQSAKSLGDLNTLLREFMLDRPRTFEVAETLVNEFGELSDAHQAVVTAREQVNTLTPAREEHHRLEELIAERGGLDELRQGLDSYREMRRIGLLEESIAKLRTRAEGLEGEIHHHEDTVENHKHALHGMEEQHRQLGGGRIERLKSERQDIEVQRTERLRKLGQASDACKALGWALPATPQDFADTAGKARRELDDWQQQSNALRDKQLDLATSKRETEKEFNEVRREVEALRRQPSNIPARMVELRDSLAAALGFPEEHLPFAGELIEVKSEEAPWRGAIERVLHGFALSLLVEERHYAALSNHINKTHLGARLVYFRTGARSAGATKTAEMNSLVRKLNTKECRHSIWLESELQRQFGYACVDSMQVFRQTERALTRAGLVRHGKSRHEKDDRHDVHDPRFWVLGFDNREKRALYEKQTQELAIKIGLLTDEIHAMTDKEDERHARAMNCQTLANMQWREVDAAPLTERILDIEQQLGNLRQGNAELEEVGRRLEEKRGLLEKAEVALREKQVDARQTSREMAGNRQELDKLRETATDIELTDEQRQGLDARFDALPDAATLKNLDQQARRVERALNEGIGEIDVERNQLEKALENRFADFKRCWPMEAGDVDAALASAPDFLAKLKRLEEDGLPAYEKRFFELLQTQSHQNLASLGTHLQQGRREIRDRMELVNESLGEAEFNAGTYLSIDVTDRQLPEVREFRQAITQTLSHALVDDRERAEQRFIVLRKLVERLSSQEAVDRRWRESVLDVRQHVEFIGRELDREGQEIEVYRSGSGKSGGQRQKLATTCLAAALRYQLGGSDHEAPVYAPVVLDEAFDKADNEFTALAMNIFVNFGFQMIVATPLKSVMTLEPFIGGACFIDIGDRRRSSVLLIQYDETRKRLKLPEQTHGDASVAAT